MREALIVSHGQPSDPEVGEAEITQLAAAIAEEAPDMRIAGVSLAAPGALEAVAAQADAAAVIYPMFMADGWFTQVQLPKRLAGRALRRLAPFGTDPALPGFASGWLAQVLEEKGWRAAETGLVVLGHGSGRSDRPAAVTRDFADAVQAQMRFAGLRVGFVEEAPYLGEALTACGAQTICLPFFATRRGHVLDDIPEALEETSFPGLVLDPIGLHPCIPGFIAAQLGAAAATS